MAEERILIRVIEPECKFRESHETTAGGHTWVDFACGKFKKWKDCEEDDFIHCEKKELIGLSRQEAIERMAKAAKKAYRGYFYVEPNHPNISDMMEAALNALLEEKDE